MVPFGPQGLKSFVKVKFPGKVDQVADVLAFQKRRHRPLFPEYRWRPHKHQGSEYNGEDITIMELVFKIRDIDSEIVCHQWYEVLLADYFNNCTVTVSFWEECQEFRCVGSLVSATSSGASALRGAGSTVSGAVRVGNTVATNGLSSVFRSQENKLLKVVYVQRGPKIRTACAKGGRGRTITQRSRIWHTWYNGKGAEYESALLDSYIRKALMVFNIVVAETKVPLTVDVALKG